MWINEDKENILENTTVTYKYLDNELKMIQLSAHDGYMIHYIHDEGYTDNDGNYNPPNYSYQVIGGTWLKIEDYEALPIEENISNLF